jgi:hypothetical protein
MTIQEIQLQIYSVGSVAFLKQVDDALVQVGKHDPLSADLAEQLAELILWQEDFSHSA